MQCLYVLDFDAIRVTLEFILYAQQMKPALTLEHYHHYIQYSSIIHSLDYNIYFAKNNNYKNTTPIDVPTNTIMYT